MLRRLVLPLLLVVALMLPRWANAHDLFPGFLELKATAASDYQVLWKLPLFKGQRLPIACLLYTSPSPRDKRQSRMPSSA